MIPGCAHTDAAICQAETCRWPGCVRHQDALPEIWPPDYWADVADAGESFNEWVAEMEAIAKAGT